MHSLNETLTSDLTPHNWNQFIHDSKRTSVPMSRNSEVTPTANASAYVHVTSFLLYMLNKGFTNVFTERFPGFMCHR